MTKNEVILTSFPKSGNTWVRFLIANVYNLLSKKVDEIDFLNIHDIIPELNSTAEPTSLFDTMPRILKTHEQYESSFQNVILVLRNPWDTLYSYLKYLNSEMKVDISLAEVVRNPQYGIGAIVDHANSYLRNCEDLLIVTYENLHNKPLKEVKKVCEFLELDAVSDEVIEKAIERSSFKTMRDIEVRKGRKFGSPDFLFTRSGQINEGYLEISRSDALGHFVLQEMRNSPLLYLLYG